MELIEAAMGKPVAREGADFLATAKRDEYIDDAPQWSDEE